jgi:hypothetical protein
LSSLNLAFSRRRRRPAQAPPETPGISALWAWAGPHSIGHTGFTATSIVIDLDAGTF